MPKPPLNFYPGPSKVWEEIPQYVQDAYEAGILSINHRSPTFDAISEKTRHLLGKKLTIPEDYWVFYVSSATEAWEIIAQSLIEARSWHFFNGAFGEKAYHYTQKLCPDAIIEATPFTLETLPKIPHNIPEDTVIYLTHNETSNGSYLPNEWLQNLRNHLPEVLITLDATSSLGGIHLPWQVLDVVYASVQKCLGLPAGMGLIICSPRAITQAQKLNKQKHYNSLAFMIDKMKDWQTTYTPNVLNIYLLMRSLEKCQSINHTDNHIRERSKKLYDFFYSQTSFRPLINNSKFRSPTVLTLANKSQNYIREIKRKAQEQNIILGNGYGEWKTGTFRVANFPALQDPEFKLLEEFFIKKLD